MIGSSVLFDSKIAIAKFAHNIYDYCEENGVKLHPVLCDTDSYMFSIKDFYTKFKSDEEFMFKFNRNKYKIFDCSTNDKKGGYYDDSVAQELNTIKNEVVGKKILEVNALCPKVYSILTEDKKCDIKSKGIAKSVRGKVLSNELYKKVINGEYKNEERHMVSQKTINNNLLIVKNTTVSKQAVTYVDIKNYYYKDSPDYLIFGSKKHLDEIKK